jgi:hypothetical protein
VPNQSADLGLGDIQEESLNRLIRRFTFQYLNPGNEAEMTLLVSHPASTTVFSNPAGVSVRSINKVSEIEEIEEKSPVPDPGAVILIGAGATLAAFRKGKRF